MGATCPAHLILLVKLSSYEVLIIHSSPTSRHFLPLSSEYSPHTLFTNTLNPCPFLSVRDQVSHPYKSTGKIIVLYIKIFEFWRRDGKTQNILNWIVENIPGI